jgi:hypothetical protein
MINNRQIISTIKIAVMECDAVRFGRDESREKTCYFHFHAKNEGRNVLQILVQIHQNTWRLILENSNSNNQR